MGWPISYQDINSPYWNSTLKGGGGGGGGHGSAHVHDLPLIAMTQACLI